MDKMLQKLEDENAGISICNLFLGGASHADDIRAISISKKVSENQCKIISNAASPNGLSLNAKKTEVVAFSLHSATNHEVMHNLNVPILTSAKCLGYKWCRSLSPKLAIEENIVNSFLHLDPLVVFWDHVILSLLNQFLKLACCQLSSMEQKIGC